MPRQTQLSSTLVVAAGILIDTDDRVLLAERVGGGPFQGLWEFPGGKLKAGESAEAALERELEEELGINVTAHSPFMRLQHDYADRSVDLHFFLVTDWRNAAQGLDGQALRWIAREDLSATELLPADQPVVDALLAIDFKS